VADDTRRIRVFVSSPADAASERSRLDRVIERINGEFQGVACLTSVRWETEFYRAHETFQKQIPEAAQCDLVVAIFRARLGTALPAEFPRMSDGRPYPSGTAYEVLSAIENAKGHGFPDVYVFRFSQPPSVQLDDPKRLEIEAQWAQLKTFFDTWFRTPEGEFRAAFHTFGSTDDFEAQIEALLRKWLEEKVLHGRSVVWPVAIKGSPFRGLAAFGAKHAPVFFGRGRDIARAVDRLKDAAEKGCPFLVLEGPSGAGKSSLLRAGVVPRLTASGVVPSIDVWRVAVMRPGEVLGDPFAALARQLFVSAADLPESEQGRPAALPELAQGDFPRPEDLADLLRHADEAALRPVLASIIAIEQLTRQTQGYERPVQAALLLAVDQLDDLFASDLSDEVRTRFTKLLGFLARSGKVWVVVTLRAGLLERFLEQENLKALKEAGATYDLVPPGHAELAEIVRAPAEAAGLVYETDRATGESLDLRILRDADRPDMLPLLQLALSELFEGRQRLDDGTVLLACRVYDGLGGITGIIDKAGEKALTSLGEEAKNAETKQLPRLLRLLAEPAAGQDASGLNTLTIRAAPLTEAAPDASARKLVDALVNARLLTASGVETQAQVQLAHQRVLADWSKAREIVAENAEFYRVRADIEEQRRRYQAGERRSELLLRGLPLAKAAHIIATYGDELTQDTRDYVAASRRRANRAQFLAWSAAVVFALAAIAAAGLAVFAFNQKAAAQVGLWLVQSQTALKSGNLSEAIETALQAHTLRPSGTTRSSLISALTAISPFARGTLHASADLPAAIAWTGQDIAVATDAGTLRALSLGASGGSSSLRWTTQASVKVEAEQAPTVALQSIGNGDLIVVYKNSTIGILRNHASAIALYKPATRASVYPLPSAVAIGRSGSLVVMATIDNAVEAFLCDWRREAENACSAHPLLSGEGQDVRAVAISPDERQVALGDQAGTIRLCSTSTSACGASSKPLPGRVASLAWAPDGTTLAAGTGSGEIVTVDAGSLAQSVVAATGKSVTALAWSPNGSQLASVCNGNVICVWTAIKSPQGVTLRVSARLVGHRGTITRLAWSPAGTMLLSVSATGEISGWGVEPDRNVFYQLPDCGAAELTSLAVLPDMSTTAAGAADGRICLWGRDGRLQASFAGKNRSRVEFLAWSQKGALGALHEDGIVELWQGGQPQPMTFPQVPTEVFSRLVFSADDQFILVTASHGQLAFLDANDAAKPAKLVDLAPVSVGMSGLAVRRSDGIAFVSTSHRIELVDVRKQAAVGSILSQQSSFSRSLALSPDERLLAASGSDSTVPVYDFAKRTSYAMRGVELRDTNAVGFSPDGRKLAALGADGKLYIWDMTESSSQPFAKVDLAASALFDKDHRDAKRPAWIAWLASEKLAASTADGRVVVVSLDESKWRTRIHDLGLVPPN
jgi:WD40 repeat protein